MAWRRLWQRFAAGVWFFVAAAGADSGELRESPVKILRGP